MYNEAVVSKIPIVYATDQNYIFTTCVSITSLAENADKKTFYLVYVMVEVGFNDEDDLLNMLNLRYSNIQIKKVFVETEIFDNVYIHNKHISKAAFYRLVICDNIHDDKCIYLDSDTIVMEDLHELWNYDIEEYYIAGCRDIWIDRLSWEECEKRRIQTNILSMDDYINSGVLVFNLKKIRADKLSETFIQQMKCKYLFEDQDILNVCCYHNILRLPEKWNNFTSSMGLDIEFREAGINEDILRVFRISNGITHYTAHEARPWKGRLSWKNRYWWHFAEKWSDTKAYQKIFQNVETSETQNNWIKCMEKYRAYQTIIIWGYTNYAMELCDWLLNAKMNAIIYFCDNDRRKCGQIYNDIAVIPPEQAFEMKQRCIYIIASQRWGEEIKAEILNNGIMPEDVQIYRRKRLAFYRMLDRKYYRQELEEIFKKEAVSMSPEQSIQELKKELIVQLKKHADWIDKYYLKRWILKEE